MAASQARASSSRNSGSDWIDPPSRCHLQLTATAAPSSPATRGPYIVRNHAHAATAAAAVQAIENACATTSGRPPSSRRSAASAAG